MASSRLIPEFLAMEACRVYRDTSASGASAPIVVQITTGGGESRFASARDPRATRTAPELQWTLDSSEFYMMDLDAARDAARAIVARALLERGDDRTPSVIWRELLNGSRLGVTVDT